MSRARFRLRSLASIVSLAAIVSYAPPAASSDALSCYDDNDEPMWAPTSVGPLSDWLDDATLAGIPDDLRPLALKIRSSQASKPMLREFYQRWQLQFPFDRELPANWREEAKRRADGVAARRRGESRILGPAWSSIGPTNVGGRITTIAIHPTDPDVAWVGAADGGVWRWNHDSSSGTWTWTPLFDSQPTLSIGSIAIDPADPRKLYVGTGEQNYSLDEYDGVGVIRSRDGGSTWLAPVSVGGAGRIGQLALSPADPNILFAATSRGLYRSGDGGDSWLLVLDGGACDDVLIDPLNPLVVYAGLAGNGSNPWGIYKSTTGGEAGSFTRLSGSGSCQLPTLNGARIALTIARSNPSVLYAALENGSGEIWKTTDAGLSWCRMATPGTFCGGQCWYDMVLAVDPSNPDYLFAGGIGFQRSSDGGRTWTAVGGMHVDQHAIRFAGGGARVALVGNDGGLYRLDVSNAAPVVKNVESGFVTAQYYGMAHDPVDPTLVYGGSQDNGTHKLASPSTNMSGVQLSGCGDGAAIRVNPGMNNRLFHSVCPGSGNLVFLVSDDFGGNSSVETTGIVVSEGSNWVPPIEVAGPSRVYTATASRVYRSDNADDANANQIRFSALDATQATITRDLTPSGGSISTIASTAADPNVVWAGTTRGHVWITTDGITWTEVWLANGGRPRYIGEVIASQTDPETAWVVLGGYGSFDSGGHVFETTNGGTSWADMSGRGDLPDVPVSAILPHPTNPDRFWAGSWLGVYETTDHGATWNLEPSVPRSAVVDLAYDSATATVYAATHGRGIWKFHDAVTGTPPRPVPDGVTDRGQPVYAARSAGGQIELSWGSATCPGDADYHLFWAPLTEKATFRYSGAACNLGTSGTASFAPPAGSVYFLMAGTNTVGEESGHRRRDGGIGFENATGLGLCTAISGRDTSQTCP